jgi:cytidyltransferase-like protein
MTKIGIFPGAFDPITKGHLQIIEMIICKGLVDKLYVMPCYRGLPRKTSWACPEDELAK